MMLKVKRLCTHNYANGKKGLVSKLFYRMSKTSLRQYQWKRKWFWTDNVTVTKKISHDVTTIKSNNLEKCNRFQIIANIFATSKKTDFSQTRLPFDTHTNKFKYPMLLKVVWFSIDNVAKNHDLLLVNIVAESQMTSSCRYCRRCFLYLF